MKANVRWQETRSVKRLEDQSEQPYRSSTDRISSGREMIVVMKAVRLCHIRELLGEIRRSNTDTQ
jgi:hypothetical protein